MRAFEIEGDLETNNADGEQEPPPTIVPLHLAATLFECLNCPGDRVHLDLKYRNGSSVNGCGRLNATRHASIEFRSTQNHAESLLLGVWS
jgi:hypothetical protein